MSLIKELKKQLIPKKLWVLRLYVGILTTISEILLILYIGFSLYNLVSQKSVMGDLILGAAGLYVVGVCLGLLFIAQIVSLFVNIHDNIEDVRNKTINPDFSIDIEDEKESKLSSNTRNIALIVTILLSIILALINFNRHPKSYSIENSTSLNSGSNNSIVTSSYKVGDNVDGYTVFAVDDSGESCLIAGEIGGKMNWEEAKQACRNKGDGWRLPSREELLAMYQHRTVLRGLLAVNKGGYWSSEENYNPSVPRNTYAFQLTSLIENNAYITDGYTSSLNNVVAVKAIGDLNHSAHTPSK